MNLRTQLSQLTLITTACVLLLSSVGGRSQSTNGNADRIPVIDMHTHVFNAKYVPVGGVARSYTSLVIGLDVATASMAAILDRIIVQLTDESALCGGKAFQAVESPELKGMNRDEVSTRLLRSRILQIKLSDREYRELAEFAGHRSSIVRGASADVKASIVERALIRALIDPLTQEDQQSMKTLSISGSLRLLYLLLRSEESIVETLREDYPDVDLFVHHMMDLQKAHGDYRPHFLFKDQLCRMKDLERRANAAPNRPNGTLLHFVAFDPYRGTEALDIVKEGLSNGAVGVKFYPPNGYRAANNDIPDRPAWYKSTARAFWNVKYKKLDDDKLDTLTDSLFSYCESNAIPVFTHCTPVGFQAVRGYGLNCDPCYWEAALRKHTNLILCLGHAGGFGWWFATNESPRSVAGSNVPHSCGVPYGEKVVELCLKYRNVYCEVGHLEQVFERTGQDNLKAQFNRHLNRSSPDGTWMFGDKLMYGTDWHMMYKYPNRREYLQQFKTIFDDPSLQSWKGRFFAENAGRYLNLGRQAQNPALSDKTRASLTAIVNRLQAKN
jgi:predicted TIM-barrel fold metal-dependent hydrolase